MPHYLKLRGGLDILTRFLIGGSEVTANAAELNVLDAVVAGTVLASSAVVVSSAKDIGTFRHLTASGAVTVGNIVGNDASLDVAGLAAASAGNGGAVPIVGGLAHTNGVGGVVSLTGGAGSAAGTGAGGTASLVGGASAGGTSGDGGAAIVTGGAAASTAGNGGAATITGGAGKGTAILGGLASVTGGASGTGAVGTGGGASLIGGASAATAGDGGAATITGGLATTTGTGGAVAITGGSSGGGSGVGGAVTIRGGPGSTGTAGAVVIDAGTGTTPATVVIGGTYASSVQIGRSGQTVNIKGVALTPTIAELNQLASRSPMFGIRRRFTTAEVNAGTTFIAAAATTILTVYNCRMRAIGGAAATVTDVRLTDSDTNKICCQPVANLTQNTLCGEWTANATTELLGQPLTTNKGLVVIKNGADMITATHIDVWIEYTVTAG